MILSLPHLYFKGFELKIAQKFLQKTSYIATYAFNKDAVPGSFCEKNIQGTFLSSLIKRESDLKKWEFLLPKVHLTNERNDKVLCISNDVNIGLFQNNKCKKYLYLTNYTPQKGFFFKKMLGLWKKSLLNDFECIFVPHENIKNKVIKDFEGKVVVVPPFISHGHISLVRKRGDKVGVFLFNNHQKKKLKDVINSNHLYIINKNDPIEKKLKSLKLKYIVKSCDDDLNAFFSEVKYTLNFDKSFPYDSYISVAAGIPSVVTENYDQFGFVRNESQISDLNCEELRRKTLKYNIAQFRMKVDKELLS